MFLLLLTLAGQVATGTTTHTSTVSQTETSTPADFVFDEVLPDVSLEVTAAPPSEPDDEGEIEEVIVHGTSAERARIAGSAYRVDDVALEQFEYDDIHRVLMQVPGVYVRGEDGYGLRPNIGLRGANSDRSAKVALMEDGVLLGPAPYSAPAAYYFPIVTRLVGVDVFKGPASIVYGPNTIGGALDLRTRRIDPGVQGYVDAAYGVNRYQKLHAATGYGAEHWGVLVEGVHLQTDGFKELDGGGDTGFAKNEVMLKAYVGTNRSDEYAHRLEVKLGYADEESNETYLGLSDGDFDATPYRRYAASQLGNMDWWRTQATLSYLLQTDRVEVRVTGYRHDFSRAWKKLNGLAGVDLGSLLKAEDSGEDAVRLAVLRGEQDASGALLIGTNARDFVSTGVQATARWRAPQLFYLVNQDIVAGLRVHQDSIRRDHDEGTYDMLNGTTVLASDIATVTDNEGRALAFAFHILDEIEIGDLLLTPGLRAELIQTSFVSTVPERRDIDNETAVLLPGIGASYSPTRWLSVIAGVHQGFSPVTPGASDDTLPEKSLNYEAGARVKLARARAEVIGFFNDYQNISGTCTFSSGCTDAMTTDQFNGGAAWVYGLEAVASHGTHAPLGFDVSGELTYTLTFSEFLTDFDSGFPQWGNVLAGYELPYVPRHQLAATVAATRPDFGLNVTARYIDRMRDRADDGPLEDIHATDRAVIIDASAYYRLFGGRLYVQAFNVTNTAYIASRRPFGARPGQPLQIYLGYKHTFE
ncbi:MAG: TonB-dependent receptor [Deltaproteobacteria bacterium]|jgi:Fe(3+) dicitrate transport protein